MSPTALVRFTSEHLTHKSRAAPYFQGAFRLELVVGLLILVAALFTPQIAYFGGPEMRPPIYIGLISSLFLSIAAYANALLQTYGRFKVMASINAVFSALRTLLFLALVVTSAVTLANALLVNLAIAVLILVVGLLIMPKTGVRALVARSETRAGRDVRLRQVADHLVCVNAVLARLDIILVSHFRPAHEVGQYAAALQLAAFMPLLLSSLTTVLIPKVSSLPDNQVGSFLRKSLFGAAVVSVVLVPAVLLAGPIVQLVFGDKYRNGLTLPADHGQFHLDAIHQSTQPAVLQVEQAEGAHVHERGDWLHDGLAHVDTHPGVRWHRHCISAVDQYGHRRRCVRRLAEPAAPEGRARCGSTVVPAF